MVELKGNESGEMDAIAKLGEDEGIKATYNAPSHVEINTRNLARKDKAGQDDVLVILKGKHSGESD
jgi:hypothetical protein